VYTPGGDGAAATATQDAVPSAQQLSTDCAFGLLTVLEQSLRTSPGERLGGASRDAWVSKADPVATVATDPESGAPTGRVTEIHVIVTALVRY
jgi:hypothetical protein